MIKLDFSSPTEGEISRSSGKMKSPAACRRIRGGAFDEDESCTSAAYTSSSSSSQARLVTRRHCHCPSSPSNCGIFEDASNVASSPQRSSESTSTTGCDLCERLRGRTDGRSDMVDATRTEEHFGQRDWRKRDESANSRAKILEKRDRTLRCDRLPLCESSARCASSVVRWNHLAAKFHGKSTDWRRLLRVVFLLFLALSPDLAAAQRRDAAVAPHNRDGGEFNQKITLLLLDNLHLRVAR